LSGNEIFVDGGAFTGDTAKIFFDKVKGVYKGYYGFEPDKKNAEQLRIFLGSTKNATVLEKGLWSNDDVLSFDSGKDTGSTISDNGSVTISVTSLDNVFKDKPESEFPTFIKMDIEGAEKQALIGAENIIKATHPKLAICVYHKVEDIYELPELIMSYFNGYKLYLRHYNKCSLSETVLYAIPSDVLQELK
jgi:FkbM family methyltransferase